MSITPERAVGKQDNGREQYGHTDKSLGAYISLLWELENGTPNQNFLQYPLITSVHQAQRLCSRAAMGNASMNTPQPATNRSPSLVYSVLPVSTGTVAVAQRIPESDEFWAITRPKGSMTSGGPILLATRTDRWVSAARIRAVRLCCAPAVVSPNPPYIG